MGRIFTNIRVCRRDCWTLFDSGTERTYIAEGVARKLRPRPLGRTWGARVGGRIRKVREACLLHACVEGSEVDALALVVDDLGRDRKGRPIDIVFGALSMKEWNIVLDMKRERLDVSRVPRDFTEFCGDVSLEQATLKVLEI